MKETNLNSVGVQSYFSGLIRKINARIFLTSCKFICVFNELKHSGGGEAIKVHADTYGETFVFGLCSENMTVLHL